MSWPVVCGLLLTCQMACAAPGSDPLRALTAKPAVRGGWTLLGKFESFDKDTLFNLVDGEAEAYFPYRFRRAISATYAKGGDRAKEARAELYEMGSLLDAYGIYSAMRDSESRPIDVGTEGFGGTTQVVFYAGRYFVKAQVYSAAAKGELLGFARAIAAELPADKKRPAELALVATAGLVPRSEQYIAESVLGYACWPKGLIAEVKTKKEPARVFVIFTASAADAATAMDKYVREVVGRGTKVKPIAAEGMRIITLKDGVQGGVAVGRAGKYLVGAADLENPEVEGPLLLGRLRRQVLAAQTPKPPSRPPAGEKRKRQG